MSLLSSSRTCLSWARSFAKKPSWKHKKWKFSSEGSGGKGTSIWRGVDNIHTNPLHILCVPSLWCACPRPTPAAASRTLSSLHLQQDEAGCFHPVDVQVQNETKVDGLPTHSVWCVQIHKQDKWTYDVCDVDIGTSLLQVYCDVFVSFPDSVPQSGASNLKWRNGVVSVNKACKQDLLIPTEDTPSMCVVIKDEYNSHMLTLFFASRLASSSTRNLTMGRCPAAAAHMSAVASV